MILTNNLPKICFTLVLATLAACSTLKVPYLEQAPTPGPVSTTASEGGAKVEGVAVEKKVLPKPDPELQFSEFDLASATEAGDMTIRPGDSLRISIWGYPELEHIAAVQPTGFITIPLAGEVKAAGLTTEELRLSIKDRLEPFTRPSSLLLRPGDQLTMSVWEQDTLLHQATVEPAGTVTFPLVGSVMVENRPLEEIHDEVQTRLRKQISFAEVTLLPNFMNRRVLQDFEVSVLSHQLQKRTIAMLGAVNIQGLQTINGSLRLSDALAQAQLDDKIAALNSIVVIRNPQTKSPQYRQIRLKDYLEGTAPNQNIYLQHEDIVIVPKTNIAQVGDFVDVFFARTIPMFMWWSSGWNAIGAEDNRETIKLINKSLENDLLEITP